MNTTSILVKLKELFISLVGMLVKNPSIKTDWFQFDRNGGDWKASVSDEVTDEVRSNISKFLWLFAETPNKLKKYFGGAEDWVGEDDELFWSPEEIEQNLLPPLYKFWQSKKMYNQLDTGKMDCTLYASITAYSNMLNVDVSLEDRKEIKRLALLQGHSETEGWYLHKAVKLVSEYLWEVKYYTEKTWSKWFYAVLKKWHTIITWYRWNAEYNKDIDDDGVVGSTSVTNPTYWHAICVTYIPTIENVCVVDNYKWVKKYNVYKLKDFDALVKNGVFFQNSFYFTAK